MDDDTRDAPPAVVGAVAAGVAPLPFLAVYAVMFIARGTVRPVVPPDVGTTKGSELAAGLVALALLVVGVLAVHWLLDGRRRWPFAGFQALVLAGSLAFAVDPRSGPPAVPVVLVLTSLAALVLAFLPASWQHLGLATPHRRRGGHKAPEPGE